jgi:hypothetical protein
MNERSRVRGTRIRVWLEMGALMLAALAVVASGTVGARAQSQAQAPASSNANSDVQIFENQSSESCDSTNHASPYVDGYNPALCFKRPLQSPYTQCAPIGGGESFLAGQVGNDCIFCQQAPTTTGIQVVIPASGGVSISGSSYQYDCAANPADPVCYLSCFGNFQFTPQPGTEPAGKDGQPPSLPNLPSTASPTQKLQGHIIFDAPDPCHPAGVELYNVCDYPNLPRPAGCVCSAAPTAQKPQPAVKPTTNTPAAAPLQAASDFSDQMRAAAETMLQNAGRISKVMTDSMNPATHNNVGVNVMLMASLGALGKTMGFVAEQYQAIAAAKVAVSAAEQGAILEIAGQSAAESGTLAGEAEEAAAQAAKAGSASTGAPVGTPMGTLGGNMVGLLPYQEGMVYLGKTVIQTTGDLPYCGVLSCARLGQLLKANASLTKAFESVQVGAEGSTPAQMVAGLQQMGINAQIATGPAAGATMAKLLGQGQPLIAGVEIFGPGGTPLVGTSGLHAVVIEAAETIGGVQGFKIYDPAGWYYWQPIETFFKYSSGVIVHAL